MDLLLTPSLLFAQVSHNTSQMVLSARSFCMIVACLMSCPKIEHSLILSAADLYWLSIFRSIVTKALLIRRLAVEEFVISDSKYVNTLILSFVVPFEAIDE